MKLLFLTDNFPPEVNAPASRTYEHCKIWAKQGIEVTVVTCFPNFPKGKVFEGYSNNFFRKENIDGIKVIRVWTYIAANQGTVKRIIDYISFMISAFIAGLFIKTDKIIATSPQFFTALSGFMLGVVKRKKWIMEVRDLWPESIKAVGAMNDSPIIRFFEWLELNLYRNAWRIITVTDSFKHCLFHRGIQKEKIKVVKNGVDPSMFTPIEKDTYLIDKYKLKDKFVIGYIGTHGMAHALQFILECASVIENTDIHFLFVGNGADRQRLLSLKEKLSLKNVTMIDMVPKSEIKRYISTIDVCLVNLKKSDTFRTVIPSKIFENCAMEKPILLGVEGEAASIIKKYHAGICFEPENQQDFLNAINTLQFKKDMYLEGCRKLTKDFNREKLANQLLKYISIEA